MTTEKAIEILHDLQTKYVEDGNDSDIIGAIDVAFEAMGVYILQNHYYRTADRLPIAEEADDEDWVIVSTDAVRWSIAPRSWVTNEKEWKFWAPVPKREVVE